MAVAPSSLPNATQVDGERWEAHRLADLGKCYRGVSYDPDRHLLERPRPDSIQLLRSNNVQVASLDLAETQHVVPSCVAPDQIMRTHDILICTANGSKELVGKAAAFAPPDAGPYTFGAFMSCFRPNPAAVSPRFASYLFQTTEYRRQVALALAGSSINNLRPAQIEDMVFRVPDRARQEVIAGVLDAATAFLGTLGGLASKKEAIRQGATDQLLSGRLRLEGFDGPWLERRLGDVGRWSGGMTPSMANPDFWDHGTTPWVASGDVKRHRLTDTALHITDAAIDMTGATILPRGSVVIVTRSGILRRYLPVATLLKPMAVNQDMKAVIPNPDVDSEFLLQAIRANGSQILATCLKAGTTVESIEYSWLKDYALLLPPLTEQQAIAAVLHDMDAEIEALEAQRSKAALLLQGMIEKLMLATPWLA
ncbi:MAG TPA: restriction endonuclease subunit S [Coriobacteriia bacterium]|nr:restriction endonuclease subunit S [Coriobacteriia bacterium]